MKKINSGDNYIYRYIHQAYTILLNECKMKMYSSCYFSLFHSPHDSLCVITLLNVIQTFKN